MNFSASLAVFLMALMGADETGRMAKTLSADMAAPWPMFSVCISIPSFHIGGLIQINDLGRGNVIMAIYLSVLFIFLSYMDEAISLDICPGL